MNKKIIIILLFVLVLTNSGCKKFLEITPQQTFTSEIAVSSLDGLTKTTTGAFAQLTSSNLYGGGIIANSELLADFVSADPIADYGLNQLRTRQMNSDNAEAGGMWGDAYRAIYMVNVVLQYLPKYQTQNPAQCQLLKGECLFIRGAMEFELVRMFAQPSGYTSGDSHLGISLVLTPGDVNTGQTTPRSTVAQCYSQIEADLDSAVNDLPASGGGEIFATQGAAQAFLMRVYFTQHNYQQALNYANAVVSSGSYSLNPSVGLIDSISGPNASTSETIFQVVSGSLLTQYINSVLIGRFRVLALTPAMYHMSGTFQPYFSADSAVNGYRSRTYPFGQPEWYVYNSSDSLPYYYCIKYNQPAMNITILRYAEVLLTRAECNAQLGNGASAVLADLNLIRERGGLLPDNTTSNQTALINEVRAQRDFELSCEGDRFFEIKRRQIGFYSPESGQYFTWNSPQLVYPIPLQEVQENKNMVQNPGY